MTNRHIGSPFADWLEEDTIAEEVNSTAIKRVLAWTSEEAMKERTHAAGLHRQTQEGEDSGEDIPAEEVFAAARERLMTTR